MRAYRAVCGGLVPTLSAPAAGTAASWLPGTLLTGFTPEEVWRNSGQVKLYLGGTVTKAVWQTCSDTRPLAPGRPRAKRLRRQTARIALRLPARDALRILMTVPRCCTLRPRIGTDADISSRKVRRSRVEGGVVPPSRECLVCRRLTREFEGRTSALH